MDLLGPFQVRARVEVPGGVDVEKMLDLIRVEVGQLADSSKRDARVLVSRDGENTLTIEVHGTGSAFYKVATSALHRYLDIMGKSFDLVSPS